MEIKFWGVRGSFPVWGKQFSRYGGHTCCASLLSSSGGRLIIDAGSGLKNLGEEMMKEPAVLAEPLYLFLTHFHLDHLLGLPFFAPLYSARAKIIFYSSRPAPQAREYLSRLMGPPFFPVSLAETPSQKEFRQIEPGQEVEVGDFRVSALALNHPQGSLAFRVEEDREGGGESSIVWATDTEHPADMQQDPLVGFVQKADLLIYDAMFTPEDYPRYQGWGHSTWLYGTKLAREAQVRKLILAHLNPDYGDRRIAEMEKRARGEFPSTRAARDSLVIKV